MEIDAPRSNADGYNAMLITLNAEAKRHEALALAATESIIQSDHLRIAEHLHAASEIIREIA